MGYHRLASQYEIARSLIGTLCWGCSGAAFEKLRLFPHGQP
jgi:hypothetical protein